MKTKFKDIEAIIKNNRTIIKKLLKANNLTEIAIPDILFQSDEDTDYYFCKVSLSNERLQYHFKYRGLNHKIYYGWYFEDSMKEYAYEENEILKYIDIHFALIKLCTSTI